MIPPKIPSPPAILLLGAMGATALFGCVSPAKQSSLDSRWLVFSIRWTLSSKGEEQSFSSRLFIKGGRALRLDLLQSLTGVFARMILKDQNLILQLPFQKTYYQGMVQKGAKTVGLPVLSSSDFSAVFRGRAPKQKGWLCQTQNDKTAFCRKKPFVILWEWEKSVLKSIRFQRQDGLGLRAEIRDLSSRSLPRRIFHPNLKGWKRELEPLFFHWKSLK